MEFSIELLGGPNDGQMVDLLTDAASGWPKAVFVSRADLAQVFAAAHLEESGMPEFADVFQEYHRTDRTSFRGRRFYAWGARQPRGPKPK